MHTMNKSLLLLSLAFLGVTLAALTPANAAAANFECALSVQPTDPARSLEMQRLLPDSNAMADIGRLTAAVGVLLREGTPKSLSINELVGAYCPMVAQENSLTETEKTARLQRFTSQITQLVYSLESGLDIIINVPLTPDVVAVLNATASKQGLSGAAWIAMTVENALQR
jgi:hypothetical protein